MKRTFFPTRLQYQAQNALKTCFPASLMAFLVRVKGIIEKKTSTDKMFTKNQCQSTEKAAYDICT